MISKFRCLCLFTLFVGITAYAEPMRPLLNKENRFPEQGKADINFRVDFVETDDSDGAGSTNYVSYIPKLRWRPTEALNVYGTVPFVTSDPDDGDDESGIGDIRVGMEFRAWEDIFGYPWVMPHIEYVSKTGDEDKGLGRDDDSVILGLAIGSVVEDMLHFIADGRYEVYSNSDNIWSIGGAIIWDISEKFSVLGEFRTSSKDVGDDDDDDDDHPTLWLGGLSYKVSEYFTWTVRGGGGANSQVDSMVSVELNYAL